MRTPDRLRDLRVRQQIFVIRSKFIHKSQRAPSNLDSSFVFQHLKIDALDYWRSFRHWD